MTDGIEWVGFDSTKMVVVLLEIDLRHFEELADLVEESLENATKEFERRVEECAESFSPDEREEWLEVNADEYQRLVDTYPRTVRHSLFVACFSYLEHQLGRLAGKVGRCNPAHPPPSRARIGDNISYLRRILGTRIPDISESWKRIDQGYRRVRNCIVHDGSDASGRDDLDQIKEFAAKNPMEIVVDDRFHLTVKQQGIKGLIAAIQVLLRALVKAEGSNFGASGLRILGS